MVQARRARSMIRGPRSLSLWASQTGWTSLTRRVKIGARNRTGAWRWTNVVTTGFDGGDRSRLQWRGWVAI
ncbi:hypothetical protein BDY21DRAFT_349618 [Lineolata rhizophorae]|uniref:Uncharacterized protein n=1 Tax=Lineolata rhizophorae TaxID=578093 RepID=A0A6A6NUW8_9PEZI|nr:hypothetical protein BDY21DRAFT_349618 [Lineolata rhizophorae]